MKYKVCNKTAVLIMSKPDKLWHQQLKVWNAHENAEEIQRYRKKLTTACDAGDKQSPGGFSITSFMEGSETPTTIDNSNDELDTYYRILTTAKQVMGTGIAFLETRFDKTLLTDFDEDKTRAFLLKHVDTRRSTPTKPTIDNLRKVRETLSAALKALKMVRTGLEKWDGKRTRVRTIAEWCHDGTDPAYRGKPKKLFAQCIIQINELVKTQSRNIADYNAKIAKTESAMTSLRTFTDFALQ